MAPKEALDLFQRVPAGLLRPYLEHRRQEAIKQLVVHMEMPYLHKLQGQISVIDELLSLLDLADKRNS